MAENTTKMISSTLSSDPSSSSPPVRTGTVVSAMYIAGVAFMVGVFFLLLWVNLCSRYCQCWHNTSVINRFNRQWLGRRSRTGTHSDESPKTGHQRKASNENELE